MPLILENGNLAWELSRLVIQRVQFASDIVEKLAFHPLQRLARLLIELLLEQYPTSQDFIAI